MSIILFNIIISHFVVGRPYSYEHVDLAGYYIEDYWKGVHEVEEDEFLRAKIWDDRLGMLTIYVVLPCFLFLAIHRAFLHRRFDPHGPSMDM